jgi:RNA polymerase sigma-70 factor (ECF subfamily)
MSPSIGQLDQRRQFETLCAPLAGDLFRFLFWMCRNRSLAEDVAQETMLRAWKSIDSLHDKESVKPWLFSIGRRELARTFERKRFQTVDIDQVVISESTALAGEDTNELDDMRRAILELEPEHREALVLQVLMGYSTQEIADQLETTQGAVLTRLFRARNALRERILGAGAGDGE